MEGGDLDRHSRLLRPIRKPATVLERCDDRTVSVARTECCMPRTSLGGLGIGLVLAALVGNVASGDGTDPLKVYKGKSVAAWVAAVKRPDGKFNLKAIRVLKELGPDAHGAVPVLIKALDDKEAGGLAAEVLAAMGPAAKDAIPCLISAFRESNGRPYARPYRTLVHIGEPAIPALKAVMRKESAAGMYAADALGDMGEVGMAVLIAALGDKSVTVRRNAARTLACMNPGAVEALEPLTKALSDDDKDVRRAAADALGAIGADAKAAVPELRRVLNDGVPEVRGAAIEALQNVGAEAKAAIPDLIEALNDTAAEVRAAAIDALGTVGRGDKSAGSARWPPSSPRTSRRACALGPSERWARSAEIRHDWLNCSRTRTSQFGGLRPGHWRNLIRRWRRLRCDSALMTPTRR